MKNIGDYTPVLVKKTIVELKRSDGIIVMKTKYGNNANITFNKTATFVLDALSQTPNVTTEDIVKLLVDKYEIDRETAKIDLMEILHKFWSIGIVDWKEKNPFTTYVKDKNGLSMHKSGHEISKKAVLFVRKSTYIDPYVDAKNYTKDYIMYGIINNIFHVYVYDHQKTAIIVNNAIDSTNVLAIYSENCNFVEIKHILHFIYEQDKNRSIILSKEVNTGFDPSKISMIYSGTLKKEIKNGDVKVFYYGASD